MLSVMSLDLFSLVLDVDSVVMEDTKFILFSHFNLGPKKYYTRKTIKSYKYILNES